MELTQIQITKQTRERLQKLRATNRESYEEIIKRLIQNANNKIKSEIKKEIRVTL